MTAPKRQRLILALTAIAGITGVALDLYDTPLIVGAVASGGLIWLQRSRKAWVLAFVLIAGGLLWSSFKGPGCSAWWRGKIVAAKAAGGLPYLAWYDLSQFVMEPCYSEHHPDWRYEDSIRLIEEETVDGQPWQQFQTDLGALWIPAPGEKAMRWLVWEMVVQSDYESDRLRIEPGDVVVDVGAHIGAFSRYALRRGAARVIAIEPDPVNLACLRENLALELASGQVVLVEAALWNETTHRPLWRDKGNTLSPSFVFEWPGGEEIDGIRLIRLDDLVGELGVDQVDYIKMDIEGAERHAIAGAVQTLRRDKPRLVICTYHLPDDPEVIASAVAEARTDYVSHAKDLDLHWYRISPKTLFFQ